MKKYSLLVLFLSLSLTCELFVSNAYAYLDPGTGTMIVQAIIAALVGAGITIKVYWAKIRYRISEKSSKSDEE